MGTYYFGVVDEQKLLVRIGNSNFNDIMWGEFKEDVEGVDWDRIDHLFGLIDESCEQKISDITGKDIAVICGSVRDTMATIVEVSYNRWSFAVWIMFGDEISKVICETDDEYHEYVKKGYKVIE